MLPEIERTIPDFVELMGKNVETVTSLASHLSRLLEFSYALGVQWRQEGRPYPDSIAFQEASEMLFGEPDEKAAALLHDYFSDGWHSLKEGGNEE